MWYQFLEYRCSLRNTEVSKGDFQVQFSISLNEYPFLWVGWNYHYSAMAQAWVLPNFFPLFLSWSIFNLQCYVSYNIYTVGFSGGASGKEPACHCRRHETQVRSLGQEDLVEEGIATCSSFLARRITWREEPGGLWSIGLQRVTTEVT